MHDLSTPKKSNFPVLGRLAKWLFSWRTLRRGLILIAILTTLVAAFYTVELVRGKWAWNKYEAELAARNESVDLTVIQPDPVPDSENFAMIPLFKDSIRFRPPLASQPPDFGPYYSSALRGASKPRYRGTWLTGERMDLAEWQAYYRTDPNPEAEADETVPRSDRPQSPAEDILLALSPREDALRQLQEGSRRPHSRFDIQYEDGFMALLPHLALIKGISQTLKLRATARLALDHVDLAYEDVALGFYLRDSIRSEPVLISCLVRIAVHSIMIQPVWEGIADGRWTSEQLRSLQRMFENDNWLADFKQAIRGEKALAMSGLDSIQRGELKLDNLLVESGSGPTGLMLLFPRGWFYQNKVTVGRLEDKYLLQPVDEMNRRIDLDAIHRIDAEFAQAPVSPYTIFARMLLPAMSKAGIKAARAQVTSDQAAVACAIERYRLDTGSLPPALKDLVPDHIESLPHDVITGKPLVYEPRGDVSYVLYSAGANQVDDGGAWPDSHAPESEGDWIWLYEMNARVRQ